MSDSKYQLVESVGNKLIPVTSYESLHIHHPSANAKGLKTGNEMDFERPGGSTSYPIISGEREEVRLLNGGHYVKKDMIFLERGSAHTQVPSPCEGYVYFDKSFGQANIYNRPKDQGGELVARIFHLKPETFALQNGSFINYGQPLGQQGQTGKAGLPDPKHYGVHAHIEFDARYLKQFDQYIKDINSGVIAPNQYPNQEQSKEVQLRPISQTQLSPPHQRLMSDAHEHVHRLYQMHGMPIDQGTQNTVLSVAATAAERGMTRIEHATVKEGQINLLQMNGMVAHAATIDGNVAANTAAEQSLNRLAELERNQAHSMHHPTQQMEQPHLVRSIT